MRNAPENGPKFFSCARSLDRSAAGRPGFRQRSSTAKSGSSSDQSGDKEGGSLATNRERKSLVLDAEVTGLQIGEAFLRLSGYPISKVTIDPGAPLPVIAPGFVPAASTPRTAPDTATPPPTRSEDSPDWLSFAGPF